MDRCPDSSWLQFGYRCRVAIAVAPYVIIDVADIVLAQICLTVFSAIWGAYNVGQCRHVTNWSQVKLSTADLISFHSSGQLDLALPVQALVPSRIKTRGRVLHSIPNPQPRGT
ncbi:hypothetical protein K474DRAFT_1670036 [Panus rudis PR-1116 ss-1]|nr:hypothetical protein K474DRAFT_1670036 [Panus rudis PR-1116 ss-1]